MEKTCSLTEQERKRQIKSVRLWKVKKQSSSTQELQHLITGCSRKSRGNGGKEIIKEIIKGNCFMLEKKKKVKLLCHVWLFATPWTVSYHTPLSKKRVSNFKKLKGKNSPKAWRKKDPHLNIPLHYFRRLPEKLSETWKWEKEITGCSIYLFSYLAILQLWRGRA